MASIFIFNRKEEPVIERPIVCVEPVVQEDVEIYGDYVGRIRAQLFVEVRARVEGFLERMHFEEGSYVKKDQVLFVINQDQYRAKADKARAQLKKDEATHLRQNVTLTVSVRCTNRMLPASWIWTMQLLHTKLQRQV